MIKVTRNEDYLSHHGVEGQKWGVQNGPPYPLDKNAQKQAKKKLAAVRNSVVYDRGLTRAQTKILNKVSSVAGNGSTATGILGAILGGGIVVGARAVKGTNYTTLRLINESSMKQGEQKLTNLLKKYGDINIDAINKAKKEFSKDELSYLNNVYKVTNHKTGTRVNKAINEQANKFARRYNF